MWRFVTLLAIVFLVMSFINLPRKKEKAIILTSAVCDQCQIRIEHTLLGQKGIYSAELNLDSKELIVVFNPEKINLIQIKNIVSDLGYDANEIKRNPESFNNLPACCKSHESH